MKLKSKKTENVIDVSEETVKENPHLFGSDKFRVVQQGSGKTPPEALETGPEDDNKLVTTSAPGEGDKKKD